MSRVSDAMRRAGQLDDDERSIGRVDDTSFGSGDDLASDPLAAPVTEVVSPVESDLPGSQGLRLQRSRVVPIEMPRDDYREDLRIADVVGLLFGRRWLIIGSVAACLVAAAVYNAGAVRFYDARARIVIDSNSPDVVPFRPVVENQDFMTQLEVLRSRGMALKTLERLHLLDSNPTRQAGQVNGLLGGLTVSFVASPTGPTRVINITVRSSDPVRAARLANGVAQAYVDQNLNNRREGSREASQELTQRLVELRQAMETSEAALQRYREQKGSVSLLDQQNIVVQKLAQLSTTLTTARTNRLEREALYQQLKAIQSSGAPLDTFSPILGNSFIQGLKAELAGLQRERRQLSEDLGDLHPDMIRVNTAIANAERRLTEEMAKVVQGIENDYKAAEATERGLAAALEDQKREVLKLNDQSMEYGALQRDAASTQQMYEAVRQRVKETQISGELQTNNAKVLDLAEVPNSPVLPRTELNLIVALLVGGFIGVGLAFGVEHLNPRIAKPSDIADALGLPLIGIAPRVRGLKNQPAALGRLSPAYEEALRGIRTRLFLSPIGAEAGSIAITSTNSGEGKTVVASKLAASMAAVGRRVLLIDADLRRPQLHRMFNIPRFPGLAEVLAGDAKPSEVLRESSTSGLFILAAGRDVADPTDLMESDRLHRLIGGLSQVFDVIILDSPPVLAVADASIIANAASSVLFVVNCGSTGRGAARAAVDRLASVQARVIGVVLNNANVDPNSEYGYSAYVAQHDERSTTAPVERATEHA